MRDSSCPWSGEKSPKTPYIYICRHFLAAFSKKTVIFWLHFSKMLSFSDCTFLPEKFVRKNKYKYTVIFWLHF